MHNLNPETLDIVRLAAFPQSEAEKPAHCLTKAELYRMVLEVAATHQEPQTLSMRSFNSLLNRLEICKSTQGYYHPADAAEIVAWLFNRHKFTSAAEFNETMGTRIWHSVASRYPKIDYPPKRN